MEKLREVDRELFNLLFWGICIRRSQQISQHTDLISQQIFFVTENECYQTVDATEVVLLRFPPVAAGGGGGEPAATRLS